MHIHHIIPRHMGGSNHPSNLIKLTVEEHAKAHYELWLICGNWQDEVAWKALSKLINAEEIHREVVRLANIGNRNASGTHKGNSKHRLGLINSDDHNKKVSETLKKKGIKPPIFTGHKLESRKAIARSNIGTRYITNGTITKKLKLGMALPAGFEFGMAKRTV